MKKIIYGMLLPVALMPLSAAAAGAGLSLSPPTGVYQLGAPFVIKVAADTGGQPVNAIEAELSYNPAEISIEKLSTEGSVLSTWSTPPVYDGAAGTIHFSGWADIPYAGENGLLISITARALKPVQGTILFNSGAMLAANGQGSNILTTMASAGYSIAPQQVAPPTAASSPPQSAAPAESKPSTPVSAASQNGQVASLISSGVQLAPVLLVFFAALVIIAFCIAYVLHRKGVRKLYLRKENREVIESDATVEI